jgi:formate hydrogenlyase subunit 3/multisubunit Na+/H+ antiporter MnhD subunit
MNQVSATGLPFLYLLFGFYLAATGASLLLRTRPRWVAGGGALAALLAALWIWSLNLSLPLWMLPTGWTIDLGAPIGFAGYTFQLQTTNAPIIATYLLITALSLLIHALYGADDLYPALIWLILSGYTLFTLLAGGPTEPIIVAPVLLIMLTALSIFALQGGRTASLVGPLRALLPPLLAAPLFLMGGWWVEQIPLNPQDLALLHNAGTLLGLGALLLLMPFPLHGAWPAASEDSPPVALLFVSLLYQLAVLHLTVQTLNAFPFVYRQSDWSLWLSALGLVTAIWGGIAALGTTHVGRLWGYAAVHDWGLILLALATPGLRSWTLVLFLFSLRTISMTTTVVGLSALEQQTGSLTMTGLRGVGLRMPWSSAAVLLGGLGLVGFPLTAGFAGHWAALQSLAIIDWRPAMAIVAASLGAMLGFVRLARLMFGAHDVRLTVHENAWHVGLAIGALLLVLAVATTPQLLNELVTRALAAFG